MTISKHIVFSSTVDYGKSRPQACLAASCVLYDPGVLVTLLVLQSALGMLKGQIDKIGLSSKQTPRLHIKAIGSAAMSMTHDRDKPFYDAFEAEFQRVCPFEALFTRSKGLTASSRRAQTSCSCVRHSGLSSR